MPCHSPGSRSPLLSPSHSLLKLCCCTKCSSIFIQCLCWPTEYKEIWVLLCPPPGREAPLDWGDLEVPRCHKPFVISSKTDCNRWRKKPQTLYSRAATTKLKLVTHHLSFLLHENTAFPGFIKILNF